MGCPAPAPGVERHKPRGGGGGRWGGARGQPPALLEPCSPRGRTGRARAAGGTHVYRSTRAVLCFHFGVFVGNGFCFLGGQHEKEEDDEEEETHPASILIWNQKLWAVVWVSDGISPPGATLGVLQPPLTHSRVRHRAGDPGPQMPPGTAEFPPHVGSVLIQGTEGITVLSSLFLTLQFCLDRKLKAKKPQTRTHSLNLPHQKPTPSPGLGILAWKAPL